METAGAVKKVNSNVITTPVKEQSVEQDQTESNANQ